MQQYTAAKNNVRFSSKEEPAYVFYVQSMFIPPAAFLPSPDNFGAGGKYGYCKLKTQTMSYSVKRAIHRFFLQSHLVGKVCLCEMRCKFSKVFSFKLNSHERIDIVVPDKRADKRCGLTVERSC